MTPKILDPISREDYKKAAVAKRCSLPHGQCLPCVSLTKRSQSQMCEQPLTMMAQTKNPYPLYNKISKPNPNDERVPGVSADLTSSV